MKQNYAMVAIDPEVHRKAKMYCARTGCTIGGLVAVLLDKHIQEATRGKQREGEEKAYGAV